MTNMQLIARRTIVEIARSYVGVPYRHQGRNRKTGVDCIGFVWCVAKELGYERSIPANYSMSPSGQLVVQEADKHLIKVEDQSTILPGQIIIMWGFEQGTPQHFAIAGEGDGLATMIHAFSRVGKVLETRFDPFWLKRVCAIYEFPNTEPWSV